MPKKTTTPGQAAASQSPRTAGDRSRGTPQKPRRRSLVEQAGAGRQRLKRVVGLAVIVVGLVMALVHVGAHLNAFGDQPTGVTDLIVGWPMAAVWVLAGLVLVGT
jgi:hypothetical protein